jgi:M6 family metalloprotease-like protein
MLAGSVAASSAWAAQAPMSVRQEVHLGCAASHPGAYPDACVHPPAVPLEDALVPYARTSGTEFAPVPRLATKFRVAVESSVAAITLSTSDISNSGAEFRSARSPIWVRVLVDGVEAAPGPVSLWFADLPASAAFTFVAQDLSLGIHIAVVEWRVDADPDADDEALATLRGASIVVRTAAADPARADTFTLAAGATVPPEPDVLAATAGADWEQIPEALLVFFMPTGGVGAVTFAGQVQSQPYALFDLGVDVLDEQGAVVSQQEVTPFAYWGPVPRADTNEVAGFEARSWTFPLAGLTDGWYVARFRWRARLFAESEDAPEIRLAARTMSVVASSEGDAGVKLVAVAPAEPPGIAVPAADWEPIPDLSALVQLPLNAQVAVTLDLETTLNSNLLLARLTLDGQPVADSEVVLAQSSLGALSYTWVLKHQTRRTPYVIGVEWLRSGNGADAKALHRHLVLAVEATPVPDLGEGPNMGAGSSLQKRRPIEPAQGARRVVFVVFDPQRPSNPVPDFDFTSQLQDEVISGPHPSANGLLQTISGGRVELDVVAVLGAYAGSEGGGEEKNHYWDVAAHDCSGADPYVSPWDHQKAEALLAAGNEFDFASFDTNRDGILDPTELGVVVVTPQQANFGQFGGFSPYCDGTPFTVGGVTIQRLLHWYTPGGGANAATRIDSVSTLGHELTHLLLGLDDLYDGATAGGRLMNTALEGTSLSTARVGAGMILHLDGVQKLHLGWVTPRIVQSAGPYQLRDVGQGREVLILPRRDGIGREYFLLEARFNSADATTGAYDFGLVESGLALYHVVEPGTGCESGNGKGCQTLNVPFCVAPASAWTAYANNFARAGIRLIQPDLVHLFTPRSFSSDLTNKIWESGAIDDVGFGFTCPKQIGDPLPFFGEPRLLWADGTASGYGLSNIAVNGDQVSLDVAVKP